MRRIFLLALSLIVTACSALPDLQPLPTLAPTLTPRPTSAAPAATAPQPTRTAVIATPNNPNVGATSVPNTIATAVLVVATTEPECLAKHTVQAGERLLRIGEQYKVDWRIIAQYNKLANPERLSVGQVLCIPSKSALAQLTAQPLTATANAPTPTATAVPLKISAVNVSDNKVDRGGKVNIKWETTGANQVNVWSMKFDRKSAVWSRDTTAPAYALSQPASGSFDLTIPVAARNPIRVEVEAVSASGQRVTQASSDIAFNCQKLFFEPQVNVSCPLAPQTANAVFQAFENGYMLWRQDTNKIYRLWNVKGSLAWDTVEATTTSDALGTPPASLQAPSAKFAAAWLQFNDLDRAQFGWATESEKTYSLTAQLNLYPGFDTNIPDSLYLTWVDGQIAHLSVLATAKEHDSGANWVLLKK